MAKYSLRKEKKHKKDKKHKKKTLKIESKKTHTNKKHKKVITRKLKNRKYQALQKGGNKFGTWVGVPNANDPTGFGFNSKSFMFKCPN
tara:strand:- start:480 stop:743 length:264 start_codon:yes stop_codon:yes gene_type:complete